MRTGIFISVILIMACVSLLGQAPQAFKYQAVIRDTTGVPLTQKEVSLRVSILKGDVSGAEIYSEIHQVLTDKLGLVNLIIGRGTETTGEFSMIPWGNDAYFVKLEIDLEGGMSFDFLGTSQLLAVPYALYAESTGDNFWENPEEGILTYTGAIGVGDLSYIDHRYSISAGGIRVGSGNWSTLDFDGTGDDSQPEWRLNAHNNGYFQIRHWDGADWNDHYLKIKPDDGFYFGISGPKLNYNFRGFLEVSDCFKVGSNNFYVSSDSTVGIGTNNPEAKLHICLKSIGHEGHAGIIIQNTSVDELSSTGMQIISGSGTSYTAISHNASTYEWEGRSDIGFLYNNAAGLIIAVTSDTGNIRFETGGAPGLAKERLRITKDGNVGIGTPIPQRILHINDVMRLEPRYLPPESPSEGDIYMDGNDHVLKVYNGTEWKSCW